MVKYNIAKQITKYQTFIKFLEANTVGFKWKAWTPPIRI